MNIQQLKTAMSKLGADQRELAVLTGVHESTISRYVNGDVKIPKRFEISLKNLLALRK